LGWSAGVSGSRWADRPVRRLRDLLGRLEPDRQPGLLLAGSTAGTTAALNAPLAGIMFGIEEMSRSFEIRVSSLVLGTVIAAGLTSLALIGDHTYFGTTDVVLPIGPQWFAVVVAEVIGGLAAVFQPRHRHARPRLHASGRSLGEK